MPEARKRNCFRAKHLKGVPQNLSPTYFSSFFLKAPLLFACEERNKRGRCWSARGWAAIKEGSLGPRDVVDFSFQNNFNWPMVTAFSRISVNDDNPAGFTQIFVNFLLQRPSWTRDEGLSNFYEIILMVCECWTEVLVAQSTSSTALV